MNLRLMSPEGRNARKGVARSSPSRGTTGYQSLPSVRGIELRTAWASDAGVCSSHLARPFGGFMPRYRLVGMDGRFIHIRPKQLRWTGWFYEAAATVGIALGKKYGRKFCHIDHMQKQKGWKFFCPTTPECPHVPAEERARCAQIKWERENS